ncbi:MAG: DUF6998 domain-containing protein [Sphaerospermopsis kisseleviana]
MKELAAIRQAAKSLSERVGREFTPLQVLVGGLGEILAAEKYDLELQPPKTDIVHVFDAVDSSGRNIRIRCDLTDSTAIHKDATGGLLLVLKLLPDVSIEEIFNGPMSAAHQLTKDRKADGSGLVELDHSDLRALMTSIPTSKRIALRSDGPHIPN